MPICIAGMHRSGTSMVTRLLNRCGLDLGPADRLLQAAPDNPEGFWECLPFVELNKQLLASAGGNWHSLPALARGWERGDEFAVQRRAAARLPAELGLREPWGWKDPRNSITLPFWESIWPDLKVVICVRNPLDVANSLLVRDQFSIGKSLRLWLEYYQALLDAAPPNRQIVTHYDSYFLDAKAEMQRVLATVGLKAEAETVRSASAEIVAGIRHNRFELADLETVGAPAKLIDMYDRHCIEAGPVFAANHRTNEQRPAAMMNLIGHAIRTENRIAERDNRIEELSHKIDALYDRLSARRYRYADKVATVARKLMASFQHFPHKRDGYATGVS